MLPLPFDEKFGAADILFCTDDCIFLPIAAVPRNENDDYDQTKGENPNGARILKGERGENVALYAGRRSELTSAESRNIPVAGRGSSMRFA